MKAAVLSIGDELLIGQTVNTNAAWLGKELTQIGIGSGGVVAHQKILLKPSRLHWMYS